MRKPENVSPLETTEAILYSKLGNLTKNLSLESASLSIEGVFQDIQENEAKFFTEVCQLIITARILIPRHLKKLWTLASTVNRCKNHSGDWTFA